MLILDHDWPRVQRNNSGDVWGIFSAQQYVSKLWVNQCRYGSIFKTNVFLRPTIFGTTPEFAKLVNTNTHLFRRSFPESFKKILGPNTFMLQDGPPHMSVRKVVLKSIGPETLRHQVRSFENIILENMDSWVRAGTVVGMDATQQVGRSFSILNILSLITQSMQFVVLQRIRFLLRVLKTPLRFLFLFFCDIF